MCLTRRGAFCVSMHCVPGVPRLWQCNTSPRISVKCRSQEKASILLQNWWRRSALPALICGVLLEDKKCRKSSSGILFFFSSGNFFLLRLQPSHLKDIWSFSTSQSPLKPGPERRWIHQEAAFPLHISTKISCYYKRALDSAAPLHSSFINRGIASALRSSQPTRDRQNSENQEKEDEQKWCKRRRCCLEVWSWLRNKSFVESSSMFSSLSRFRLEQPTKWMSATATPDFWETQNAEFIKKKKNCKIYETWSLWLNERSGFKNMEMHFSWQSWKTKMLHSSLYAHVATSGLASEHFKF